MAKKKKSPNNGQLWQSVQTVAHECVSLRERLTTLENLFDLLLTYKGENENFVEFVKSKIEGDKNEADKIQDTDKKDNEGSSPDKGTGPERVRAHAE